MNKRIVLSSVSIFASLALVTGATFAFFSDSGTSSGNVFGAGTLDLQLDDTNDPFANDITATFNVSDMAPGDSAAQEISLHNEGSVDIAEIAMGLTSTNVDPDADPSDLRDVLDMEVRAGGSKSGDVCTGGTDVTGAIDAVVGNGGVPLTMAEFTGDTYDSLPIALPAAGADSQVCISVAMQSTAGDIYQGDSATASFVFTAHQDVSQ